MSSAPPLISYAGNNPNTKLALHLVASEEYLECAELTPASCDSINVDLSVAELIAAGGYGYIVLVAYDIESITGLEFAITGWPTGRGAPALSGPFWCADRLTLGDHLDGGGITSFGSCVEPDSSGMAALAYWTFGPLDSTDLPIDLSILASTFTDEDSLLYVMDCTVGYAQDNVVAPSGCAIGGAYSGTQPACGGNEDGRGSPLGPPSVRFLGPSVQRPEGGAWINLAGENVNTHTEVYLESDREEGRIEARAVFLGDGLFAFKAATAAADLGTWSVVVSNGVGGSTVLEDALHLVPSLIRYREEQSDAEYLRGAVSVKLRSGALSLPQGRDVALPIEADIRSAALSEIMDNHSISEIERIFKGRTPADTLAQDTNGHTVHVDDLSQFYMLHLPPSIDPADVATELEILPDVKQVWLMRPIVQFADSLEPDDYFYTQFPDSADSSQWNLRKIGCPEAWAKDTCSAGIHIAIIDTGVRYTHEDLGGSSDSTDFPNGKVVGGWNFIDDNGYPYATDLRFSHGTLCAGVAAAAANNGIGMAGVGWDAKVLAYKCCNRHEAACVVQWANAVLRSILDSAGAVSMSFGVDCAAGGMVELRQSVREAHTCGLTLVAAGGNANAPYPYPCPAGLDGVIGVAATTRADHYKPGNRFGPHIDIAAPTGVVSTDNRNDTSYEPGVGGTSMSAPHVAGVAALIQSRALSLFDSLYYGEDICGLICASADTATSPAQQEYPNQYVGWGRISAGKALARLEEPYNEGEGPKLISGSGVDTYTYDDTVFVFIEDGDTTEYFR